MDDSRVLFLSDFPTAIQSQVWEGAFNRRIVSIGGAARLDHLRRVLIFSVGFFFLPARTLPGGDDET